MEGGGGGGGGVGANNLLEESYRMMSRGWKVEVQHVYRETNKVADTLVKVAKLQIRELHY